MPSKNRGEKSRRARQCLVSAALVLAGAVAAPVVASATSSGPVATALGYNPVGSDLIDGPQWIRLWDANTTWAQVEPQPGQFDFTTLDNDVSEAAQHHQKVILTLGMAPAWGPDIHDWNVYVSVVATRYAGRIAAYEPWNEPNLHMFYTGSVSEMVLLARSAFGDIRLHDPAAKVLTPAWSQSGQRWFTAYARAGGLKYADAVAVHSYPRHPGDVATTIESFRAIGGSKPIWMTEVGCNTAWSVGCTYANPAGTGAFARTELHAIHMHNVPVVLWYPLNGEGGNWMGFTSVSPWLLSYVN